MIKNEQTRVDQMIGDAYKQGFARGAEAAAALANEYRITHPYRVDDCILMKLNVSKKSKPRKNTKRIQEVK